MLTYYEGNQTTVIVPETIDGKTVTAIGEWCFEMDRSAETIQLPDTITHIGYGAFTECTNLQKINIPESVVCIEYYAFDYCTSLTSLHLPAGVTSFYVDDMQYTLIGLSSLKEFTVDAKTLLMLQLMVFYIIKTKHRLFACRMHTRVWLLWKIP